MKEYNIYYRERGNVNSVEFICTLTVNNKKEARKNFEEWDNQDKLWTITKIELA